VKKITAELNDNTIYVDREKITLPSGWVIYQNHELDKLGAIRVFNGRDIIGFSMFEILKNSTPLEAQAEILRFLAKPHSITFCFPGSDKPTKG
jgi:hypothetical protein